MSRFDKICLLLALAGFPLLWHFSPSLPAADPDAGRKSEQTWTTPERTSPKDLGAFRKKLLVAAPLGYAPQQQQQKKSAAAKEQSLLLYGTFQAGGKITALMAMGDTVQLLREGDTLADGSAVLSIVTNSVSIRLQNGDEKKITLYEESL